MPRNLRFFYFGNQCPHNAYLLARIKTLAWKESVMLHLHDVTGDEAICSEYRIFSPQMLVVNDKYRIHGPFTTDRILSLMNDDDPGPVEPPLTQGVDVVRGDLVPLTPSTALSTCDTCAGSPDPGLCMGKAEWVGEMMKASGMPHLGYIHLVRGRCVGGAECLPSNLVPYPLPDKSDKNAFITCAYASDALFDYKRHPVEMLLGELANLGFERASVAASKEGVFPNGPASWFEGLGFEDAGLLVREEMHGAEVRLMTRRL